MRLKDKQILIFQAAFAPDFKGLVYKLRGGWAGQTGGSMETVLFKAVFAMGQGLRIKEDTDI